MTEKTSEELKEMDDNLSAARDHAWNWFEYHAGQRLAVFRFFLIVVAVISAGFFKAFMEDHSGASLAVSVLAMLSTYSFYLLDKRNRVLVKIAEDYLVDEQKRLAIAINNVKIKFIEQSESRKTGKPLCSFSQVNGLIFLSIGLFSVIGAIVSMYKLGWFGPIVNKIASFFA